MFWFLRNYMVRNMNNYFFLRMALKLCQTLITFHLTGPRNFGEGIGW